MENQNVAISKGNVPNLDIIAGNNIPKYEEDNNDASSKLKISNLEEKIRKEESVVPSVSVEPVIETKLQNKEYDSSYVTDDQFFDDFFNDDED